MVDNIKQSEALEENQTDKKDLKDANKMKFVWYNCILIPANHIMSVYAIYLIFTQTMWQTTLFAFLLGVISNVGVTAGAHRLWSHRAYKVKTPLKLLLVFMFTLAYQGSVKNWVLDHRTHHKYVDTDADPHNSRRGFVFSHIGWLFVRKRPEVIIKGKTVDISDVQNDPILRIQHKYCFLWIFLLAIHMPTYFPLLWGQDKWTSFFVAVILRHTVALHMIFLINSAAHMWGYKPYDKDIYPTENKIVSFLASGEGFHNYHHTFPWDYRAAELGSYMFNLSGLFIDTMAKIGWAYDLKTASEELIEKRVMRSGDGSHPVWGWNDKDLPDEYKNVAKILY